MNYGYNSKLNSLNAYDYYNNQTYDVEEEAADGSACVIKRARYKFPQLVVNQWISNILAEDPFIEVNEEEYNIGLDLKMVLNEVLAYGDCFIVPEVSFDDINYILISRWGNGVKEEYRDNKLVFLEYSVKKNEYSAQKDMTETIKYTYKHYYDPNTRIYTREVYVDGMLDENIQEYYNLDNMLPFKVVNKDLNGYGRPVYINAKEIINEIDNTMNDMRSDREISQPIMLLPEYMVKSTTEIDENMNFKVSDKYLGHKKMFRIMPGDDENLKPEQWRGDWTPSTYIEYLNYLLHLLSIQCGFGEKYFSYDTNTGLKTATEIYSEKDDMYKNKKMYDSILEKVIERILLTENILFNSVNEMPMQYDIIFSDSLITDDQAKQEMLFRDFTAGAIDAQSYLEMSGYSQQEIEMINQRKGEGINQEMVTTPLE